MSCFNLIFWWMLEEIVTLGVALFRWNMLHLSRKQLIKLLFWFLTSKKRYPFIFLHYLLCLSYKITHRLLNGHELEYASFYHCKKLSPILCVVKNWYSILIEIINKSVKSVFGHRILILLNRNILPKWYFELRPFFMSSQHIPTPTPKLQGHLSSFLLMLKRQCIRVWLCKLVVVCK